jgi:hypothetical protein
MKFVIILLWSILFSIFSSIVLANTIDLECNLKRWGDQYKKFLIESKDDKSYYISLLKPDKNTKKWWQFWIDDYDSKEYFSIDPIREKLLFPNGLTGVAIWPTQFIIVISENCPSSKDSSTCLLDINLQSYIYTINRITGEITGSYTATDNSYAPYFKSGDIVYSVTGQCSRIEREF